MTPDIITAALNLGVGGLFFVMWFFERKDRVKKDDESRKVTDALATANSNNEKLIEVVTNNTVAVTLATNAIQTMGQELELVKSKVMN